MAGKISEYPAKTVFNDTDLYDCSTAGTASEKVTFAQLKTELDSSLSFLSNVDLGYTAVTNTITNTGGADAVLPTFTSTEDGLVPLSGGGTTNFLRADGTWAAAGGGNTIYTGDDTLTSNRTVSLGAFGLGIGTAPEAGKALTIGGDIQVNGDVSIGSHCEVGSITTQAIFAHPTYYNVNDAAVKQLSTGATYVNAPLGQLIYFRVDGTPRLSISSTLADFTADVTAEGDGLFASSNAKISNFGNSALFAHNDQIDVFDAALRQLNTGDTYLNAPTGSNVYLAVNASAKLTVKSTGVINISSLPTSSAGLSTGDLFTQTATQLGGSGTTKVVCAA